MALQSGNILIVKSDTMSDTDSGGGNITSEVVVGGESNNIFNDISPLDRTTGALHLRKIFPSVSIQTLDTYFGAHTIISKIPEDTQVGVCLFDTSDWHDRRVAASNRIAGYFAKGTDYPGFLYGTAWAGSKTINVFQSTTAPLPLVGDVMILTQGSESQYIRVSELESSIQTFTVGTVTFQRNIVTITITNSLEFDFIGAAISNQDDISPPTLISETIVADSAKYYSARPLDAVVAIGDSQVKADTLFTQLVPNTLIETAKVDQDPSGNVISNYSASDDSFSYTTSTTFQTGVVYSLGGAVASTTLEIITTLGNITDSGGSVLHNGIVIGSINYNTGTITFSSQSPSFYNSKTIGFKPAAPIVNVAASTSTPVTVANRGQIFTKSINETIGKGSAVVSFRSLDNWYELTDNSSGGLVSNGVGSGTIDYDTGIFSVNLAELPDVDSEIIWSWGSPVAVEQVSTTALDYTDTQSFSNTIDDGFVAIVELPNVDNMNVSSLTVSWTYSGSKTLTTDTAGNFSGDATGKVIRTGDGYVLNISFDVLPSIGTELTVAYDTHSATSTAVDYPSTKQGDGTLDFTIPGAPLEPGSVYINWSVNTFDHQDPYTKTLNDGKIVNVGYRDDGLGGFVNFLNTAIPNFTINYTTGAVTIDPIGKVEVATIEDTDGIFSLTSDFVEVRPTLGDTQVYARAVTTTAVSTDGTTYPVNTLQFVGNGDGRAMDIVGGSVRFTHVSSTYHTHGYVVSNSSNVAVGSINKENSVVTMNSWTVGLANGPITLSSMLTVTDTVLPATPTLAATYNGVSEFTFKIDGAPLKSQSLEITIPYQTTTATSSQVSYPVGYSGVIQPRLVTLPITRVDQSLAFTADANGVLTSLNTGTGTAVGTGTVNIDTGIVKVYVEDLSGDPVFFDPSALRYTVSTKRYIPIDGDLLGIDHVRLPENGRVPAFAIGDVVVLHNTRELTESPAQGATTDTGQLFLSKVSVVDSTGTTLQSTQYSVDLDTGIITWTNLTGVINPLTINYSIEDLSTLSDIQIDGTLDFTTPVKHDYPIANSLVSNALIHGDMFANVSNPFDQNTWTGTWSDDIIGSTTLGEFNNTQYPISVNNQDCIEERWLIQFTSSATINVIGENSGQVLTGQSIGNPDGTIAPINPATGYPYFTIDNHSFGGGWSSGNVIRFNTHAANAPVWIIQSVNQGAASTTDDDALRFCIEVRGARNTVV